MRSTSAKKTPKRKPSRPAEPVTFEVGSGNVFADMGLPNPEVLLAKATLVAKLQLILESRNLTTAKTAVFLNIDAQRLQRLLVRVLNKTSRCFWMEINIVQHWWPEIPLVHENHVLFRLVHALITADPCA